MKVPPVLPLVLALVSFALPACNNRREEHHHVSHKITATNPEKKDVTITQQYVCQIHSQRHIQVRALERGYLESISIKEGQTVKSGDSLFTLIPILYQAKLDAENAEAKVAELEYQYTKKLNEKGVVSPNEVALKLAELGKAQARAKEAAGELWFTNIKAPFDGIIDRLLQQQGSLVEEGDILTTLSDNSLMWVYFNVPEARYLEYKAGLDREHLEIELILANGQKFNQPGVIAAIEADFNNETGNILFRADFANPDRLLRHGQTGTILVKHIVKNAIVIPQRSTFEILSQRYVYVINKDNEVHRHEITIKNELEDLFIVDGIGPEDRIVLEGVRQLEKDGEKIEYEEHSLDEISKNLKFHAE